MGYNKPFHRNYRKMKQGHNSGYSDWAYIIDRDYAQQPEQYTRAFMMIQGDILELFEYVEPDDINHSTYSFRIHELLMRTCIEVEANFKAILKENIFTPTIGRGPRAGELRPEKDWNIKDFRIVNRTHHLDEYSVVLPFWKGDSNTRKPFKEWKSSDTLSWYQAYNQSKHDRIHNFHKANLDNLINAYSGLFVLLSAQFRTESFAPGNGSIGLEAGHGYYKGEFGLGGFLMIQFPDDWSEEEMYDFNWTDLRKQSTRIEKIDYNRL